MPITENSYRLRSKNLPLYSKFTKHLLGFVVVTGIGDVFVVRAELEDA